MLSLDKCRQLVGKGSDAELELARDQLYAMADVAVCSFLDRRTNERGVRQAGFRDALKLLPPGDADDATERAAIIEFEAGRYRDEAERQAILAVAHKRKRHGRG
jgi:hypothetical protein